MKPSLWTASEINDLRNNIVPSTRTMNAARNKASKLNIEFHPKCGDKCVQLNLSADDRRRIAEAVKKERNKAHVAMRFGVSRNYVLECCKEFHVETIPSPHERLGEHIEYDGHNWSWKKGSWICTSSRVRATGEYNLGKVLWKKFHGVYPDAGHDVRFKDGNRYNLAKENLVLLTKSEAQKLRLKDPMNRARCYATGCLGLLMNAVAEMQDPQRRKDRCKKAAETSRRLHPDRGRKAWETRRKRAEERGFFFTAEQIKKMSESHKGKPNPNKGRKYGKDKKDKDICRY